MTAAEDDVLTKANALCAFGHSKGAHHRGNTIRTFSMSCGAADCDCGWYAPAESVKGEPEMSACNCNPADNTGGYHSPTCPEFDPQHGMEGPQF